MSLSFADIHQGMFQLISEGLFLRTPVVCGSFRRAVPFVEQLQNSEICIIKIQKKKSNDFFTYGLFLAHGEFILNNAVSIYFVTRILKTANNSFT